MTTLTMKAVVCTRYGAPKYLQVQEIAKPSPKAGELLIKVNASTVTAADTMMRRADPFISRFFLGFFRPGKSVMGTGFAGVVEAVGENVQRFQPGDDVFGESGLNFGANAEYVCVAEDGVILPKPAAIDFEEAATLTDGPLTSYNFLMNLGELKPGQRVLINGASGSLGTAAVQLAHHLGAEVTGICSGKNAALVRELGADEVIDYTQEDFTKNGVQYDLIYDTIGSLSFSQCKNSLSEAGKYMTPKLRFGTLIQMLKTSWFGKKKAIFSATGLMKAPRLRGYLQEILQLIAQRRLKVIIDRRYPLEKTPEGHQYVDQGHKRGNLVIVV